MFKIANLKLKFRLILAPLAGVSDFPFRMLNRKFSPGLEFAEMINGRSLSYKGKKTQHMLYSEPKDRPLGVQLLGSQPAFILRAIEILKQYKFDILDFNAACPVKKVVNRGEGAALLRHPRKLNSLLKIIVKESNVPVTVKIRTGWDRDSVNIKEIASACQDSGISAVFIHGRTRDQGYSPTVDYKAIGKLKSRLSIPLIASGDILSGRLAKKMFEETGCDAVLIARGVLGNPWIFREISEFLRNGEIINRPTALEQSKTIIEHLTMCTKFYGEKNGVRIFRKHLIWYTKGLHRIRSLREAICQMKTKDSMIGFIRGCFDQGSAP